MNTIAEESFSNIRTVKAFCNEQAEIGKFKLANLNVFAKGKSKAWLQSANQTLSLLLLNAGLGVVIYVSSLQIQNGTLTIGLLSTFLFYMVTLSFQFFIVSWTLGNFGSVLGASEKVIQFMEIETKVNAHGGSALDDDAVSGVLELKNVSFNYPTKPDVQVLNDVSLKVDAKKNRVVALCGTSGCGKSSIISLIERFYDPQHGQVLFNGTDIRELEPQWYHNQVAIVQQEPVLFSGTIKENILFGLDLGDMSDEDQNKLIDEAVRKANAYDFIHDSDMFPQCYETVVGERGVKLSGG